MGTAGAASWTLQRQAAFARALGYCAICLSSLDLGFLDIHKTQTLTLQLNSQGCSEIPMRTWAEGALRILMCV